MKQQFFFWYALISFSYCFSHHVVEGTSFDVLHLAPLVEDPFCLMAISSSQVVAMLLQHLRPRASPVLDKFQTSGQSLVCSILDWIFTFLFKSQSSCSNLYTCRVSNFVHHCLSFAKRTEVEHPSSHRMNLQGSLSII